MRISVNEWIVFSDFDGTVTFLDSTDVLVSKYGGEQNRRDEALFASGKATNREVMLRHYQTIKPAPENLYDIFRALPIDPWFLTFYGAWKAAGGSFAILTGNIVEAVDFCLSHNGVRGIPIYGNHVANQDGAMVFFCGDPEKETLCKTGSCAFCKSARLEKARCDNKKVIYLGDGLTDLCAAKHADLLFAKGILADHCRQNGIDHQRFEGFLDIHRYIWGEP